MARFVQKTRAENLEKRTEDEVVRVLHGSDGERYH
jgi:hypothetical protein